MKSVGRVSWYCLGILFGLAAIASGSSPAPVEIVSPVIDAQGHLVEAVAPDAKKYPVFRQPPESPFVSQLREVLHSGPAQQVLVLERFARTLRSQERNAATGEPRPASLAPMYLLLSNEEGGFARYGFWMERTNGRRELVMAGYVDLVVDQRSVDSGGFEEIFCHELGHLILRSLLGDLSHGPSRKMHQSMTVTDYPTAFDEGYAEHFQPLARDETKNPVLRKIQSGTGTTDLDLLWLSNLDTQLRTDGVKRNLFVHRKAPPAVNAGQGADLYQVFLNEESSTQFLNGALKNGQEMMASEGVIATLFYRLVNRESLRNRYREPAFCRQFLEANAGRDTDPQKEISPYENVNLKLFAAMRQVAPEAGDSSRPLAIALIDAYAKLFPEEAKNVYDLFLATTYAVTASQEAATAFERAAAAGQVGDLDSYRQDSRAAFSLLDQITNRVAKGDLALDANLGPELWLLNDDFKIAPAVWERERTVPLSINLNTASEPELMTLPGVDSALAARIVSTRHSRGYFSSLDEVGLIEGVSPALVEAMKGMAEKMRKAGMYARQ
ncbi:MAG TPA: helix-hairpin-helix domain-containing protein [Terriglobia bacterium]|nr:helix-hairpin-helix domain-containing protein [Terriglobia bacterium]